MPKNTIACVLRLRASIQNDNRRYESKFNGFTLKNKRVSFSNKHLVIKFQFYNLSCIALVEDIAIIHPLLQLEPMQNKLCKKLPLQLYYGR